MRGGIDGRHRASFIPTGAPRQGAHARLTCGNVVRGSSAPANRRDLLQVRRHRRCYPSEPGRRRHPAEGRLGRAEAHRAAPAGVRRPSCLPPARRARTIMRWCVCSGCSAYASPRLAALTSPTSATSPATSCSTSSEKGPSRQTSRCRSRSCAPSVKPSTDAPPGRSCAPAPGGRMDRAGASRALTRVARAAGISHQISPHGLRRTFCTTGLVAGIAIRDMQYAMRHADPEPPSGTTWPRPTSTATPPTPSPPTWRG